MQFTTRFSLLGKRGKNSLSLQHTRTYIKREGEKKLTLYLENQLHCTWTRIFSKTLFKLKLKYNQKNAYIYLL